MSNNISIRRISLISDFACHDQAISTYNLAQAKQSIINVYNISDDTIIRFNELNPVACTLDKKQYRFFANWDYITEFYRRDIDKIHIAIHTNLSEDEIKRYTLLHQLAVSFSSIGDHNLANLVNVIKQLNKADRQSIFQDAYSYSAIKTVENLTGKHRNSIKNQLSKKNYLESKAENKISILDRILRK